MGTVSLYYSIEALKLTAAGLNRVLPSRMLTKTIRITNKVTRASKALRMPQPAKATHITRRGSKREGTAVSENLMVTEKIFAFLGKAEFNGSAVRPLSSAHIGQVT